MADEKVAAWSLVLEAHEEPTILPSAVVETSSVALFLLALEKEECNPAIAAVAVALVVVLMRMEIDLAFLRLHQQGSLFQVRIQVFQI